MPLLHLDIKHNFLWNGWKLHRPDGKIWYKSAKMVCYALGGVAFHMSHGNDGASVSWVRLALVFA